MKAAWFFYLYLKQGYERRNSLLCFRTSVPQLNLAWIVFFQDSIASAAEKSFNFGILFSC